MMDKGWFRGTRTLRLRGGKIGLCWCWCWRLGVRNNWKMAAGRRSRILAVLSVSWAIHRMPQPPGARDMERRPMQVSGDCQRNTSKPGLGEKRPEPWDGSTASFCRHPPSNEHTVQARAICLIVSLTSWCHTALHSIFNTMTDVRYIHLKDQVLANHVP